MFTIFTASIISRFTTKALKIDDQRKAEFVKLNFLKI
jgi:hypothetical protein